MTDRRPDRQAKNEVLFRGLNERVHATTDELNAASSLDPPDRSEYLCECAEIACMERVSLSRAEYENARSNPIWFFIVPGHDVVAIETVIETNDRFALVEKHPGEISIATATDPRS
jgi:hypothetical protein